jgi:tetratricopeptide (TPR) repeat protein
MGLILILLATCVAYFPAMSGGPLWDDEAHITTPELQSLDGLRRIWFEPGATQQYYPLLHTAFWIEHTLWRDWYPGYHAVTLLWHLSAVSLVYVILQRLKIPGALLAAAIFALHPVMVESVAWITEQKNTLSAAFYLGAMLAYLYFDESRNRSHYLLALGLFVLGLLTKTVTATLPAALLVIFWWQRGTLSWKRDVSPLLPFFVLGAAAGLATAWIERQMIGAQGADFELTFFQRGLLAGRVIWFYIANLFWPANLIFIYPRWQIDPSQWWQWLYPAATLGTTLALWAIRRRSRAPLAGWLFFAGTLFPVLGFLNVYPFLYSYVADHFQYLASLGIIVPVSAAAARFFSSLPLPRQALATATCFAIVCALAVLTWRQSQMYADSITLYQTTLNRNPDCWMAHFNLAWDLTKTGRQEEAIDHYREVINLRPKYVEAYNNLGRVLIDAGQIPAAIKELEAVLSLQPDHHSALNNLGIALDHSGRYDEAIKTLERSIQVQPNSAEAHQNLGNTFMRVGRLPEAVEQMEHALKLAPNDAEAHNNMGVVLVQTGKVPQAIEHFRRAVELNPHDPKAHANLGKTLMDTGNHGEAFLELHQALQLQPGRADLHNCLGQILAANGRTNDAIEHFQTALRLDPNLAETYQFVAVAYSLAHRTDEAIAAAEQGINVARSTSQQETAQAIEQWLKQYRAQLNAAGKSQ